MRKDDKIANCSASADSEIIYIVDNDELYAYYLEPNQVANEVQELPINYVLVSKEELTFIQYEETLLLTGVN